MATNYANATYTEVIDLQTVADQQSIIGIHTPVGMSPYARLKGFFQQFRKFKYNGIKSLVMIPAAQLPVDPLGLTGVVGTTDLMDPRDSLNPILFHGCHGEHLTTILDEIYGSVSVPRAGTGDPEPIAGNNVAPSADEFRMGSQYDMSEYYAKLTDSSWRKFGIQQGVKLSNMRPLVWQVAQNMPTLPSFTSATTGDHPRQYINRGLFDDMQVDTSSGDIGFTTIGTQGTINEPVVPRQYMELVPDYVDGVLSVRPAYKQQFTNRMTTLGWLPTSYDNGISTGGPTATQTLIPRLFMGVLVLPPAYNVEQYFRMVITHSFSFKEFTSSLSLMDPNSAGNASPLVNPNERVPYENWIDYGDTLDSIGAKSQTVSDGVM